MDEQDLPTRPITPDAHAMQLARHVLKSRFEYDHRDSNALIKAARAAGVPHERTYFGASDADARSVIHELADQNLRQAPAWRIQQRIDTHTKKIEGSISHTIARFNPRVLGGRGAAGRVRDRARAQECRSIDADSIARLRAELTRRAIA
ncbi:hypothetical protein [Paraburkholderia youngii]|uniref:hypothetical protein n=1 Tax=Paraburkholderia youngii TaxID=2782701 RepID=UPI003D215775